MRKIVFTLLLIFLYSCDYTPIYSSGDAKFKINEIELKGNKKVNKIVLRQISRLKQNNSSLIYDLKINSSKEIKSVSKDEKGETKILVSTTVIEVGVDVPNATVMVIESAERFGLSQIHQLRGRVGRGTKQSYCILMTKYKLTEDAKERINALVKSSDGFKIADVDLKIRGPGNLIGTQQSGLLDLSLANLSEDFLILERARKEAIQVISEDPDFKLEKNKTIANYIKTDVTFNVHWGRIS